MGGVIAMVYGTVLSLPIWEFDNIIYFTIYGAFVFGGILSVIAWLLQTRAFLSILIWFGLVIIALGTMGAFTITADIMRHRMPVSIIIISQWFGVPWLLVIFGTLLALIGGFVSRLRYLWVSLIVIGFFCVLSFSGVWVLFLKSGASLEEALVSSLPGIFCIVEGILIRQLKRKPEAK